MPFTKESEGAAWRAALARMECLDPLMADVLRAKSEAERLATGAGMWRSARDMLGRLLRAEHPEWSLDMLQRETARRMSGDDQ
ncbi:MAG: hypothetical protein WD278_14050 [Pirellulales bacterium]